MVNQELIKLANQILLSSVEGNNEIRVEIKLESVLMSSYQDKVGKMQSVSLYYSHTDGRHGTSIFSLKEKIDGYDVDSGYFSIIWDKVTDLSIFSSDYYTIITIDKFKISIKNK